MHSNLSDVSFLSQIRMLERSKIECPFMYDIYNEFYYECYQGYKFYTPMDLNTYREIYVDQQYGDSFTGTLLDIGSNTGLFAFFALSHGAKKVVCYEPYFPAYNVMDRRLYSMKETRIKANNCAVYDHNGFIPFKPWHTTGCVEEKSNHKVWTVRASSIIDPIYSLVKIDTEGSEYPIIKNLYDTQTLDRTPEYRIEIHDMSATYGKTQDVINMFTCSGYNVISDIEINTDPYVHMLHFSK